MLSAERLLAGAENPYLRPNAFAQAARALGQIENGADYLSWLGRLDPRQGVRSVLALGHIGARAAPNDPARVLGSHRVPSGTWRKLGVSRGSVLRVVMAAGRAGAELDRIAGVSDAIRRVKAEAWAACFGRSLEHTLALEAVIRDHDVLILGETGTGKELVARAIQAAVPGPADGGPAPSAAFNVAAVPDSLVESELFGHVKGAFTGATETRLGRIRSGHTGSLFLDEIGDLPLSAQVKLLRVMETDVVNPLGSDSGFRADVRYIAATHGNLEDLVEAGAFRQDLFQRLGGSVIRLPPLRERPEDLLHIGQRFIAEHLPDAHVLDLGDVEGWLGSSEATDYAWPGNVRELQNVLRDLMLGLSPRPEHFRGTAPVRLDPPQAILDGKASLTGVEQWYLEYVLKRKQGNYSEAARVLGIDRSTLYRRVKRRREGRAGTGLRRGEATR